jgi:hypothetical protein
MNKPNIKIVYHLADGSIVTDDFNHWDVSIEDLFHSFKAALYRMTYHPNTISAFFQEDNSDLAYKVRATNLLKDVVDEISEDLGNSDLLNKIKSFLDE